MSDYIWLQGKAKWAKLSAPDKYGNWSIQVYPTPKSLEEFRALKEKRNLLNQEKRDDDGSYFIFRRPTQKMMRGKVVGFAPPEVLKADGESPLRESIIGNGSDVTVKVEVYGYTPPGASKQSYATRLNSVRVDNLVPFSNTSFDPDQQQLVAGMSDQPPQVFTGWGPPKE